MSESQVKVRFFTQETAAELQAPEAPLFVPVLLKRYGLSEVVNHLLHTETPVPFDFLIDGLLLRVSLAEYLQKHGLSAETSLQIEYTRAVLPPLFLASFNNEDWVLSVALLPGALQAPILAGSYDAVVRTYTPSGAVDTQFVGHLAPVRAVRWIYPHRIVSAGNDRQLRLWRTAAAAEGAEDDLDDTDAAPGLGRTWAILDGHKAPVVALAVDAASRRVLLASSDGAVGVWLTTPKDMNVVEPYADHGGSLAVKKRRKMAARDAAVRHRAPLLLLESHRQPVEGVVFDVADASVAYSVSQDHTIKTWDLVTLRCVDTRTTGYSLLLVVQLPLRLIALGLSARHINLHDPRTHAGATDIHTRQLVGHLNFVVALAQCPLSEHRFASASHDGTVKVWDVRAESPLSTVKLDKKVFGLDWSADIGIVSGGEDKKVSIHLSQT